SRTQRGGLVLAPFGRLPLGSSADRMRTYRVVSERLKSIGVLARQRMWSGLVEQLGVQPGLTAGPAVLSWPALRCLADVGLRRDLAGVSLWRLALKLSGPVAPWRAGRRPIPTYVQRAHQRRRCGRYPCDCQSLSARLTRRRGYSCGRAQMHLRGTTAPGQTP